MKKKRILITGGAGFQGTHLVERCVALGHEVSVLNTPSPQAVANAKKYLKEKVIIIWGSITDKEIVEKSMREKDVVFHLAAHVNVDQSIEEAGQTLFANIWGTHNILEVARKYENRIIYTSSCEVYGKPDSLPITETAELRPHSPYAASKAAADRLVFSYYKTYGLHVMIARFFNIYGERQKEGRFGAVIPIFVKKAIDGGPLPVFGLGEQTRDYLHISDVIDGYEAFLEHEDIDGEVINFATGQGTTIKSIADYIAKNFGVAIQNLPPRPGEASDMIGDSTKAEQLLNWKAKVSVWDGIDRYIAWRKGLHV